MSGNDKYVDLIMTRLREKTKLKLIEAARRTMEVAVRQTKKDSGNAANNWQVETNLTRGPRGLTYSMGVYPVGNRGDGGTSEASLIYKKVAEVGNLTRRLPAKELKSITIYSNLEEESEYARRALIAEAMQAASNPDTKG